jgi:hypothetical protein
MAESWIGGDALQALDDLNLGGRDDPALGKGRLLYLPERGPDEKRQKTQKDRKKKEFSRCPLRWRST